MTSNNSNCVDSLPRRGLGTGGCLFVIVKTPDYTDFTNAAPSADLWISCSSDFRLLTSEVLPASGLSPPGRIKTPHLSRGEFMLWSVPQDVRPQHPRPRVSEGAARAVSQMSALDYQNAALWHSLYHFRAACGDEHHCHCACCVGSGCHIAL